MNLYKSWALKNKYNPNREHRQFWADDDTLWLFEFDRETSEGVKVVLKMDRCESCQEEIENIKFVRYNEL